MRDTSALREKAEALRALHRPGQPLVLVNAWDCATARLFERAGSAAIATTSAGIAFSYGYPDGQKIPPAELIPVRGGVHRPFDGTWSWCTVPAYGDAGAGMSYAEKHLLPGEQLVYRTGLHWIVLLAPIAFVVLSLAFALWSILRPPDAASGPVRVFGLVLLGLALLVFLVKLVYFRSAEFAVTSKRVMLKIGWMRRHSLELILTKVEAISVDQDFRGRVFGYGTITVMGTGGTKETFETLAHPFEFRSQVQGQIHS